MEGGMKKNKVAVGISVGILILVCISVGILFTDIMPPGGGQIALTNPRFTLSVTRDELGGGHPQSAIILAGFRRDDSNNTKFRLVKVDTGSGGVNINTSVPEINVLGDVVAAGNASYPKTSDPPYLANTLFGLRRLKVGSIEKSYLDTFQLTSLDPLLFRVWSTELRDSSESNLVRPTCMDILWRRNSQGDQPYLVVGWGYDAAPDPPFGVAGRLSFFLLKDFHKQDPQPPLVADKTITIPGNPSEVIDDDSAATVGGFGSSGSNSVRVTSTNVDGGSPLSGGWLIDVTWSPDLYVRTPVVNASEFDQENPGESVGADLAKDYTSLMERAPDLDRRLFKLDPDKPCDNDCPEQNSQRIIWVQQLDVSEPPPAEEYCLGFETPLSSSGRMQFFSDIAVSPPYGLIPECETSPYCLANSLLFATTHDEHLFVTEHSAVNAPAYMEYLLKDQQNEHEITQALGLYVWFIYAPGTYDRSPYSLVVVADRAEAGADSKFHFYNFASLFPGSPASDFCSADPQAVRALASLGVPNDVVNNQTLRYYPVQVSGFPLAITQ
jgi:hypothetical protein